MAEQSPFARRREGDMYYTLDGRGWIYTDFEDPRYNQDIGDFYAVGNYCTDHDLMKQRALHETLNRLLWRFSMENGGDKLQLSNPDGKKWYIYYDPQTSFGFHTMYTFRAIHLDAIYFATKELADRALYDIVLPFIKAHPMYKI